MWSAQGQCVYKGNFGFAYDFLSCFFSPLSFSFFHMNTHTAAESLSGFFLLRSFTLPFSLSVSFSLPHRLSHAVCLALWDFSLSHFLSRSPLFSLLSFCMLRKCLHTSQGLRESCAAIIGLLNNRQTNVRHKAQDQYEMLASFEVVKSNQSTSDE